MAKRDTVLCTCCGGTGRIELNGVYGDTLDLLRKETKGGKETHGAALARIVGCKPTAMNNRLTYLADHGFATARVYGRKKFFVAK